MDPFDPRVASLQRSVRRLQWLTGGLAVALTGVVLMAQAPQKADLSVRELRAEQIIVSANGKTATLRPESLQLESGTKEQGLSAGLRLVNDGFARLELRRWSQQGSSHAQLDVSDGSRLGLAHRKGQATRGAEMSTYSNQRPGDDEPFVEVATEGRAGRLIPGAFIPAKP
ncbi:MAG: hypothetical protein Q8L48_21900 [Archangium sp.]|nr:hypothetical protein [Archangium sp.]